VQKQMEIAGSEVRAVSVMVATFTAVISLLFSSKVYHWQGAWLMANGMGLGR
jgi:hypothetical protein